MNQCRAKMVILMLALGKSQKTCHFLGLWSAVGGLNGVCWAKTFLLLIFHSHMFTA